LDLCHGCIDGRIEHIAQDEEKSYFSMLMHQGLQVGESSTVTPSRDRTTSSVDQEITWL
jgi:hypothetical protein